MAIYKVEVRVGDEVRTRLVEAPNEIGAFKHVARDYLTVEKVGTADQIKAMAELAAKGVKVETVAE